MRKTAIMAVAATVLLGAGQCNDEDDGTDVDPSADCHAESSPVNVKAWIDNMPSTDGTGPKLHVEFSFNTGNLQDEYDLIFSHADKKNPPIYNYDLVRTKVGVNREETKVDFKYRKSNFSETELDGINVFCGGKPFLTIKDVETIQ